MNKKKIKIDEFLVEEEFHGKITKDIKKQRKILEKTDRSKYKKTDLDKAKNIKITSMTSKKELSSGRAISISGEGTTVLSEDNNKYICSVSGALKNKVSRDKNIIAVGDIVLFSKETKDTGAIIEIETRNSTLSRTDPVRKKKQILAVNIDQVLITTSVVQPFLKPTLVDRYIIATTQGGMHPVIVINKIDLLNGKNKDFSKEEIKEEKLKYKSFVKAYEKAGFEVISVSTVSKKGISKLKKIMKNKSSVFSGQSGTGKSSLINQMLGTSFKTGKVVKKTYKGAHTTTTANLIPLADGGFCIDTPGIKSFGLWDLNKKEIKNYFPEFYPFEGKCKFVNCLHINEPGCKVKEAIENNEISSLRFDSYHSLIEESEQENKKR